jgi:hypothetical protein
MLTRETARLDARVVLLPRELRDGEAAQFGDRLKQVGIIRVVWLEVDKVGLVFPSDADETIWCCEFRAVRRVSLSEQLFDVNLEDEI